MYTIYIHILHITIHNVSFLNICNVVNTGEKENSCFIQCWNLPERESGMPAVIDFLSRRYPYVFHSYLILSLSNIFNNLISFILEQSLWYVDVQWNHRNILIFQAHSYIIIIFTSWIIKVTFFSIDYTILMI